MEHHDRLSVSLRHSFLEAQQISALTKNPCRLQQTILVVELRGFEPLTFSLRTRRATNCAIAPGT